LAGIIFATFIGWMFGEVKTPDSFFSAPDFHTVFLKLDIWGALKLSLVPAIIAIMFTDLFDSISTFIGVAHAADLLDEHGHPKNLKQALVVDSFATLGAGLAGTSSGTAYIESIAGVQMGGRTGLTSVFTALCFLPCFFLAPLAGMVPSFATASVLILVGASMFRSVGKISFGKLEEGLPAFLTIILIPLTFSITQGILWGFISHVGLYLIVGRHRDIHPMMYVLAVISVGLLLLEHGKFS
jgi:AGZA family xanthine/uracil permease-like MFS transporter